MASTGQGALQSQKIDGGSPLEVIVSIIVDLFTAIGMLLPFYLPYIIVVTLSLSIMVFRGWGDIREKVATHAAVLWLALNIWGAMVLVWGTTLGVRAYIISMSSNGITPSDSMASQMLSDEGRGHVFMLIFTSSIAMVVLGGAGGALQGMLFERRFPEVTLARWVSANAAFWPVTYLGSMLLGLLAALIFRGLSPVFVIIPAGIVSGLFMARRINELAVSTALDERWPESKKAEPEPEPGPYPIRQPAKELPLSEHRMALSQAPSVDSLLGQLGSAALVVLVLMGVIMSLGIWADASRPRPLTPEEVAVAQATATAISRAPEVSGILYTAEIHVQEAANYLANGHKKLHDTYQQYAIDSCTRAIELNAAHAPAYFRRALSYEALEEYELARSDLHQVLALSPEQELKLDAERELTEVQNKLALPTPDTKKRRRR